MAQTRPTSNNIHVFVRSRPQNKLERESRVRDIIKVVSSKEIVTREKKFRFDQVFPQDTNQLDVYMSVVSPMIPEIVAGYNCTVFAYGPTGSGKTYTMTGNNCESTTNWKEVSTVGCIPRAAAHIFEELLKGRHESNVKVSYLELYNEEIRDLLSDDDSLLSIYNDTKGSVFIQGLKEISVQDTESLCKQLQKGTSKRQTAHTLINHQSSRSHTVFSVTVTTRETSITGEDILKTGKLNLVDLAGSENIVRSGCKDVRFVELANINKSLLTLGRVIQNLSEKGQRHIPYRDSKLTRILQDSLGGHTKTCIIANISPNSTSYEETVSTLEYAARARDIKNTPTVNEKLTRAQVIKGLHDEIDRLQKDLDAARDKSGFFVNKDNYDQLIQTIELITGEKVTMQELLRKQHLRIEELEEIMHTRTKEFDDNVAMCKMRKELLDKAKELIKAKKENLKQEQFVSQVYEVEASQLHSQAQQLLSKTKLLSAEKTILEEKLQKQYDINITNQSTSQSAISQILETLYEISEESEILKTSNEKVHESCKEDLVDLKNEIQRPLVEVKNVLLFFETNVAQQLLIKDELRDTISNYILILRDKTENIAAMIDFHIEKLEDFSLDTLKIFLSRLEYITQIFSNDVYDLAVILHKTLADEELALKQKIDELEHYLILRKKQEDAILREKMELETKILNEVKSVKIEFEARNFEERGNQYLENLKLVSEKSRQSCKDITEKLETSMMFQHTTTPPKNIPIMVLAHIDELKDRMNTMSAKLEETKTQSKFTVENVSTVARDIADTLDMQMVRLDSRFEFLINDKGTFERKFESFVKQTDLILKSDFLGKFVSAEHQGDAPARRAEFVARSFQPPARRQILIEKFRDEQALLSHQPSSASILLGYPEGVPSTSKALLEPSSASYLLGYPEGVPSTSSTLLQPSSASHLLGYPEGVPSTSSTLLQPSSVSFLLRYPEGVPSTSSTLLEPSSASFLLGYPEGVPSTSSTLLEPAAFKSALSYFHDESKRVRSTSSLPSESVFESAMNLQSLEMVQSTSSSLPPESTSGLGPNLRDVEPGPSDSSIPPESFSGLGPLNLEEVAPIDSSIPPESTSGLSLNLGDSDVFSVDSSNLPESAFQSAQNLLELELAPSTSRSLPFESTPRSGEPEEIASTSSLPMQSAYGSGQNLSDLDLGTIPPESPSGSVLIQADSEVVPRDSSTPPDV